MSTSNQSENTATDNASGQVRRQSIARSRAGSLWARMRAPSNSSSRSSVNTLESRITSNIVNITDKNQITKNAPFSVAQFSKIRPVSAATKRAIKHSIVSSGGFSRLLPVLGYFIVENSAKHVSGDEMSSESAASAVAVDGDGAAELPVFLLDGAHRILAMREII